MFKAAYGFADPPLLWPKSVPATEKLITAQSELAARQKLTQILCSKALKPSDVIFGDLVQIYPRHSNQKTEKGLISFSSARHW